MPAEKSGAASKRTKKAAGKRGAKTSKTSARPRGKTKARSTRVPRTATRTSAKHAAVRIESAVKSETQQRIGETELKIQRLEKPESAAVIVLAGYLQRREANEIMKITTSLQEEKFTKIIFDLAGVKYANSSAIGAFVNCASTLKTDGGRAILLGMRQNLKKVFDTLGLTGLFTVAATTDEAMQAAAQ